MEEVGGGGEGVDVDVGIELSHQIEEGVVEAPVEVRGGQIAQLCFGGGGGGVTRL